MRAISGIQPRRQPRQSRARVTVDAIVEATSRVLVAEGYDRASTNRIAEAAGVSIGSLYQYFGSKEALVAALADLHVARMVAAMTRSLSGCASGDLATDARRVALGLIAAYRVNARLHDVLCQEVPKVANLGSVYDFEAWVVARGREHLDAISHEVRLADLDRAMFLLSHAVPSAIRAAVQADPEGRDDARLAEEVAELALRYLVEAPRLRESGIAPRTDHTERREPALRLTA
jgi:AcrR family transcriptional regulator